MAGTPSTGLFSVTETLGDGLASIDPHGPIWKDHSQAERQAHLERNIKKQKQRRRRRMEESNTDALAAALEVDLNSTCDDPMATNTGGASACTYDCERLVEEYFPTPQPQQTRCFMFDATTSTCPESGGHGDKLLSMRQNFIDLTTVAGVRLACDADAHYAGTARC